VVVDLDGDLNVDFVVMALTKRKTNDCIIVALLIRHSSRSKFRFRFTSMSKSMSTHPPRAQSPLDAVVCHLFGNQTEPRAATAPPPAPKSRGTWVLDSSAVAQAANNAVDRARIGAGGRIENVRISASEREGPCWVKISRKSSRRAVSPACIAGVL